jgi:glucose dehydrogenase
MPTFAGLDAEETYGVGEKDMWGMTMLDQLWCRIQFKKARWEGPMTPAGTDTVFFFPGSLGGSNWGSVSFDPERQIMVGNWNRVPMLLKLIDRESQPARPEGGRRFARHLGGWRRASGRRAVCR